MKYLILLIIPFLIITCAKEESDSISAVLQFTTASVRIDSVNNQSSTPVCIDFSNNSSITVKYTVTSNGHYGSDDVDRIVRNSFINVTRARLYFGDNYVTISNPENVYYNKTVTTEAEVIKTAINNAGISDGTYVLTIELVLDEYNGNNVHTATNQTLYHTFGQVQITSDGSGC